MNPVDSTKLMVPLIQARRFIPPANGVSRASRPQWKSTTERAASPRRESIPISLFPGVVSLIVAASLNGPSRAGPGRAGEEASGLRGPGQGSHDQPADDGSRGQAGGPCVEDHD